MQRLSAIAISILIAGLSPAHAADPREIFGTILGEIGRQIEKNQHNNLQKNHLKRLHRLWTACSKGKLTACDRAAQFPNLNDEARAEISRMREAAEQRPAYERNFYACQKMNRVACEAALAYRYASDVDRVNLQNWQRAANHQYQQALSQFRRNEQNCHAGSVTACDAALTQRQLDESATSGIQRQRAQLLFSEEQRQLRVRQREAALREYTALHDACAAGQRAACKNAAAHPQVRQADIAFLKLRDRELGPITERVANFVAEAQTSISKEGVSIGGIVMALLGLFALIGTGAGVRQILRNRVSPTGVQADEPPRLDTNPPVEPPAHFSAQMFPLTGHMPTDVRRALFGVQQ